jgi:hypothetical protein
VAKEETAALVKSASGAIRPCVAVTPGPGPRAGLAMAGKLIVAALERWRAVGRRHPALLQAGAVANGGGPAGRPALEVVAVSTSPAVAKMVWTEPMRDHPGRLLLDLDYIVEWVSAEPPATTLSFWICPVTLVFDQAWDLTADINLQGWSFQLFSTQSGGLDPTSAAGLGGQWPVTSSPLSSAHAASPSTCAARRSTVPAIGFLSRTGEDSASPRKATPADRADMRP